VLTNPPRREPVGAPDWQMPDLELSVAEVEALVDFLNARSY
jgi:hypothetical protein